MAIPDQIENVESSGNPSATNDRSSASGLGGFTNGTWVDVVRKHRPDVADGKSDDELLALKTDPALAHEMTGAYAGDNQAILTKNGLPVTPGTTYLAHFAGPGGAVKVLQADPNAPVESLLSPAAIAANPFLKGMSAQGLQAWAAKKMGAAAPVAGIQANAAPTQMQAPSQPPPQPASLAAPIFAKAPGASNAATPQPFTDAAVPIPPIFAPARKPLDLSALQNALAQHAPIFPNQG